MIKLIVTLIFVTTGRLYDKTNCYLILVTAGRLYDKTNCYLILVTIGRLYDNLIKLIVT